MYASDIDGALATRYGNRFLIEDAPDGDLPEVGMPATDAMRLIPEDLTLEGDPQRNLAGHRRQPAPQLHRPRRVPAHRGNRAALHPDARRPFPRSGRDGGRPDPRLLRGHHVGRSLAEVELA